MRIMIQFNEKNYAVDLTKPLDISIPIHFEGDQLSAFGAPPAEKHAYQAGDFIGDVTQGGSCNCESYTIIPHCNGTHTESIGHIAKNCIYIHDILEDSLLAATLITIMPEEMENGDKVITGENLKNSLAPHHARFLQALAIRTLPNAPDKVTQNYGVAMPPYFTSDAMEYIATLGVKHLLVDMPSVDRLDDGGKLANHRIFWNVAAGDNNLQPSSKTITELIYAPDMVKDGVYLLNLQVAAFKADAAPSRPVLYEVTPS